MGLFGKKDPCAICGGNVKGLFPKKIEGQLICNECHGIVDLPPGIENAMGLEDFKTYMAFREENGKLKERFEITKNVDFGWLDDKFVFDMPHRLFCLDKNLTKTIFEGSQITSFVIREDAVPLFEGSAAGLIRHDSQVPAMARAMGPQINQFRMQERLDRVLDRLDGDDDDRNRRELRFDLPEPFENFLVEINFNHPYWTIFTADMKGPTFNSTLPDVNDYLRDYHRDAAVMEELALALMEVAFPGAPVDGASAAQKNDISVNVAEAPTSPSDLVAELKKLKELQDMGIITEEEFAAKKKQLLGI